MIKRPLGSGTECCVIYKLCKKDQINTKKIQDLIVNLRSTEDEVSKTGSVDGDVTGSRKQMQSSSIASSLE